MTEPDQFPRPSFAVTVDVVLLTGDGDAPTVVVVRRSNDPYRGDWVLPGGFVDIDEDLATAAIREMGEETGIDLDEAEINQLGAYGKPGRDPRMRVVTVAYWAWREVAPSPDAGSDAADCRVVSVAGLLADPGSLAFDHHQILVDALDALEISGLAR